MFKIGDRVRCVDNYERTASLKLENVYTVTATGTILLRADRFVAVEVESARGVPSKDEWDRIAREKAWRRGAAGITEVGEAKKSPTRMKGPDLSGVARAVARSIARDAIVNAFQLGTVGAGVDIGATRE